MRYNILFSNYSMGFLLSFPARRRATLTISWAPSWSMLEQAFFFDVLGAPGMLLSTFFSFFLSCHFSLSSHMKLNFFIPKWFEPTHCIYQCTKYIGKNILCFCCRSGGHKLPERANRAGIPFCLKTFLANLAGQPNSKVHQVKEAVSLTCWMKCWVPGH